MLQPSGCTSGQTGQIQMCDSIDKFSIVSDHNDATALFSAKSGVWNIFFEIVC